MRIAESELIINTDGSVFHLHLRPEELADNVILVGDPGRVDMIAEGIQTCIPRICLCDRKIQGCQDDGALYRNRH